MSESERLLATDADARGERPNSCAHAIAASLAFVVGFRRLAGSEQVAGAGVNCSLVPGHAKRKPGNPKISGSVL
jgi:hypothetical protein